VNRAIMECPELVNRTVQSLKILDDPRYGREVHIEFTDGTMFTVTLQVETTVEAKHYRETGGELEVLQEHYDVLAEG
jgi:hypothetical protein